jgi:hypothetical protein
MFRFSEAQRVYRLRDDFGRQYMASTTNSRSNLPRLTLQCHIFGAFLFSFYTTNKKGETNRNKGKPKASRVQTNREANAIGTVATDCATCATFDLFNRVGGYFEQKRASLQETNAPTQGKHKAVLKQVPKSPKHPKSPAIHGCVIGLKE